MITIFKEILAENLYIYHFIQINQFHTKSVFFSNCRNGRNVAINTFMEQLYQCVDITFVLFLEKITMITNVILIFYNSSMNVKLIKRLVLDTILPVFALFRQQK